MFTSFGMIHKKLARRQSDYRPNVRFSARSMANRLFQSEYTLKVDNENQSFACIIYDITSANFCTIKTTSKVI